MDLVRGKGNIEKMTGRTLVIFRIISTIWMGMGCLFFVGDADDRVCMKKIDRKSDKQECRKKDQV